MPPNQPLQPQPPQEPVQSQPTYQSYQPISATKSSNTSVSFLSIVVVFLLAIIAIGGLYFYANKGALSGVAELTNTPTAPSAASTTSKSCANNDLNCLLLAAQSCSPNSVLNVSAGVSTKYEIIGVDGLNCHYKESYLGGMIVFSQALIDKAIREGSKQSEIDDFRNFLQKAVDLTKGKTADCKAPVSELGAYLQARMQSIKEFEETGSASASTDSIESKFINNRCTGLN